MPRGTVHRPSNSSARPVRFVFINSPLMDEFFIALGDLVARAGGQPSAEELRRLGDRYDSVFTDLPATGSIAIHNERR